MVTRQLYTVKRIPSKRPGVPTTYEILGPGAPEKPIASAAIATMIRDHLERAAIEIRAQALQDAGVELQFEALASLAAPDCTHCNGRGHLVIHERNAAGGGGSNVDRVCWCVSTRPVDVLKAKVAA